MYIEKKILPSTSCCLLPVLMVFLLALKPLAALQLQPDGTCPLVVFIPFTDIREGPPEAIVEPGVEYYGYGEWPSPESLGKAAFSWMAAAQMAKDHFVSSQSSDTYCSFSLLSSITNLTDICLTE